MQIKAPQYITVRQAAEILCCTDTALRSIISRNMIEAVKQKRNVFVDYSDVLTYHSRKKDLPSWEAVDKHPGTYVDLDEAAHRMLVGRAYIKSLIRKGKIVGFVRCDGQILVQEQSINDRLFAKVTNAANDL